MYIQQLFNNKIIFICMIAWASAQGIKVLLSLYQDKKFDYSKICGSGGMPSSHSALVSALAICIGKSNGFDSPLFAVSAVMGMIVMYDAAGVRRAAGKHAQVLNILLSKNETDFDANLKELLGHTPLQVLMGAILGVLLAFYL